MKKILLIILLFTISTILSFSQGSSTPTWQKTLIAKGAASLTGNVSLTNTGTFGVKSTGVIKFLTGAQLSIFSYKKGSGDSAFLQMLNFSNKTQILLKSVSALGSSYIQSYGGYGILLSAEGIINNVGLVVDTTKFQIQSAYAGFIGASYDQDYSANFTARSLIDKGYAASIYAPLISPTLSGTVTTTGVIAAAAGSAAAPSITYTGQLNMGFYKISSTQLGVSVNGGLIGGWSTAGLFADYITEKTSGHGINAVKNIIHNGVVTTYTTTANITAAAVAGGVIAYTGSAHSLTMPTTTAISAIVDVSQATDFDFKVDNTGGSGTVTIVLDASQTALAIVAGGNTLTIASGTIGKFIITFVGGGASSFVSRIQ